MTNTKKILLIGAFSNNPEIYTYATSFYTTLQALGFHVEAFNYRIAPLPITGHIFDQINQRIINTKLHQHAKALQPDLIFCIKTETITAKTIAQLKHTTHAKIINFYPDNPFTLWNGNSNQEVLKTLPLYDCFLAWSHALIPALQTAGCKHVCYFPFAYDQDLFDQPITITPAEQKKYTTDVCFIGTWEPEREAWLQHIVEKLPHISLAIWGNMWLQKCSHPGLKTCVRGNAMYNQEMIKAFRNSKIVLNFIRTQNMFSHNMRTMEVPSSKAFLLTQRSIEQAEKLFKEGTSIACFENYDELIDKILFYVDHEDRRNQITINSNQTVKAYTLKKQLQSYFEHCPINNA